MIIFYVLAVLWSICAIGVIRLILDIRKEHRMRQRLERVMVQRPTVHTAEIEIDYNPETSYKLPVFRPPVPRA